MRTLIPFITLALVACGYSEDKFNEDFAAKLCETIESEECGSGTCTDTGTGTGTEEPAADCEYDSKKAKECIDAEWTCVDMGGGFMFPDIPASCLEVYVCEGGTTEPTTSATM